MPPPELMLPFNLEPEEMALWLNVLTAVAEDQISVTSTNMAVHNPSLTLVPGNSTPSSASMGTSHTCSVHACRKNTHRHRHTHTMNKSSKQRKCSLSGEVLRGDAKFRE